MQRINILNVPFDPLFELEALAKIIDHLKSGEKTFFIATPNPEMLLTAKKDHKFAKILNNTDINIPDGIGILWAADYIKKTAADKSKIIKTLKGLTGLVRIIFDRPSFKELPERITGTDMMQLICKNIGPSYPIYLLGGGKGIADTTAEVLTKKYKNIVIGTNDGSANPSYDDKIINDINKAQPQILFVAFGAPKQELWIARNIDRLDNVKLVIGIGGAFDFISGNVKRAPSFMQKLGIEWLYRLIRQPSRIKRIINATIIFPWRVIKSSF